LPGGGSRSPCWAPGHRRSAPNGRGRSFSCSASTGGASAPGAAGTIPSQGLGREYFGRLGSVLVRVCPSLIALLALATAATGFLLLFASLPVGLLWRSRRYLDDATAVQLTRNPTGLYRGLKHLGETGAVIPGGEGVAHLFIVGTAGRRAQRETFTEREGLLMGMHPSLERRLARLERMGVRP
jgi:Zn-dependent protease with chaperone function